MRPIPLNDGWSYRHLADGAGAGGGSGADDGAGSGAGTTSAAPAEPWRAATLPHDAMLFEPRRPDAPSGRNSG